jgi:WD40 repeat protein
LDKTARLWDAKTGECRHVLTDHTDEVNRAAFSPHGDLLASASSDKTVRVWDVESGKCRAVIQDLPDYVWDIDWVSTSDANLVVNGCQDGSVWVWELIDNGEDQFRVRLRWSSTNNALVLRNANIQGVKGLSDLDKQLLNQFVAASEPVHPPYEAPSNTRVGQSES